MNGQTCSEYGFISISSHFLGKVKEDAGYVTSFDSDRAI